jgi:lactam utilization protein B
MTMHTIDLNCDLGEGCGNDADIVPLISSANISCGAHAGDDGTIAETLRLCAAHGVTVGAHPGYAEREHFGRRETGQSPQEIAALVKAQVEHFLTARCTTAQHGMSRSRRRWRARCSGSIHRCVWSGCQARRC